jgi:hypothetical protein
VAERIGGGFGEVHRLAGARLALAAGQQQQAVDELLAALGGRPHALGHAAQLALAGGRVGEGDVDTRI